MQNHQNAAVASHQGWFVGAPMTRLLAYMTVLSYGIVESNGWHEKLSVDTAAILYQGQIYRFITGTLTFRNTGELIVGVLVLVNLSRRFEREMGTRKYVVWLTGVALLSIAFQVVVGQLYPDGFRYSGPYPTIGALALMFHMYSPRLHPRFFGLFGLYFSEKSMAYAFCAQIMFYRGYSSVVPCICGAVSALLMTAFAPKFDIPNFLASAVTTIMARFIDDPPAPIVQRLVRPPAAGPPPQPLAAVGEPMFEQLPPPSEEAIEQLTSMGFGRESVLRALQQSHNNVERAADHLLTGS